jgi:hypothetical protein
MAKLSVGGSAAMRRVLGRFRNGDVTGSLERGYRARCPVHDDKVASLSIDQGSDGQVLFKCHAGCGFKSIVKALGLTIADTFDRDPSQPLKQSEPRRGSGIIATYDYVDEDGSLLYQVQRRADKRGFPQRRPDGRGGWIYKLGDVRRVLYQLPIVIEAVAAGQTIYVAEGEKDVHTLERLGVVGTTNPGGAGRGKWRDEFSETLSGASVVLVSDNDAAGRAHMQSAAESLTRYGANVRLVELPGMPEKGDITDWVEAGGTLQQLEELAESTVEWTQRAAVSQDATGLPAPTRACEIPPDAPVTFSIEDLFTAGDFGLIAGEDGSMKTTLALHLCGAMAGGYKALGRFATTPGPVLFVSEEDSAGVLRNRLEAICRGHGWNIEAVLRNVHVFAKAEVRLTDAAWRSHLMAQIKRLGAKLVVFDPWVEVTTGNENDNSEGRVLLQIVRTFTKPTGANVVAVHHFGKPAEGKRQRDRIRGNTAVPSGSRFTYVVEHDETVHELKVTCLKLSRGEKLTPFVIRYLIETEDNNRAVWRSARFEYVTAQVAIIDKAEAFVLEQLGLGERMNTTELKAAAKGTGVSGADISRTLKLLEMRRLIDYEMAEKGAKRWGLVLVAEHSGQPGQPENLLAGQPDCLPGNQNGADVCLPSPFRGKQDAGTLASSFGSQNANADRVA